MQSVTPNHYDDHDDPNAAPRAQAATTEGRIETTCAWLCCAALVVLMVMTSCEVVARAVFNYSFQITDDVGGYLLVFITFMSLPVCQVRHSFHSIAFVQGRLSVRGKSWSRLVFTIMSILFAATMSWQLSLFELGVWRNGDVAATALATPMWLPQLSMSLGMTLLLYALLKTAWVEICMLRGGGLPAEDTNAARPGADHVA